MVFDGFVLLDNIVLQTNVTEKWTWVVVLLKNIWSRKLIIFISRG